jgi:hypothetical protein
MQRIVATFALAAFGFGAAPAADPERTITGVLIDQTCYLKNDRNIGPAHLECATICAKRGAPLAVLAADARIYVMAGDLTKENSLKLRPYIGRKVEVGGRLLEQRDGKLYVVTDDPSGARAGGQKPAAGQRQIKGRILDERDGLIIEARDIKPAK